MPCRVRQGETCPAGLGRGKHALQSYVGGNMLLGVG